MKKILFRKLLFDCLIFFFITLMSVGIILWVFQAVNYLDIMIEDGRSYGVYINYTLLNFPKIISKILPFSLFFSFSYVLARYETNNELIVFWNNGVDKIEIINFFLKFSIIIMIMQIFLTALLVPKSQELARSFIKSSSVDFFDSFVKPQKFNDTIKNLIIYTEKKNEDGSLENIYIKKGVENNFQITYAKKGNFKSIGGVKLLILYDGHTINGLNDKITNFNFTKFDFNLSNLSSFTITTAKTQEISTKELFLCARNFYEIISKNLEIPEYETLNCNLRNLDNIYKELYKRLLVPFYIPILIIISLMLIIRSKESINFTNYKIAVFILGLLLIIFSETSLKFIVSNLMENIKIFILPIIIFVISYFLILYDLRLKLKTNSRKF